MPSVQERVKGHIDRLADAEVEVLERLLSSLDAVPEERGWQEFLAAAFENLFDQDEYEYPDNAGEPM